MEQSMSAEFMVLVLGGVFLITLAGLAWLHMFLFQQLQKSHYDYLHDLKSELGHILDEIHAEHRMRSAELNDAIKNVNMEIEHHARTSLDHLNEVDRKVSRLADSGPIPQLRGQPSG
jgi:hypothetical protein